MKAICQGSVRFVNKKSFVKNDDNGNKENVEYFKNTIKDNNSGQFVSFNTDTNIYKEEDILYLEGEVDFKEYKGKLYLSMASPVVRKMALSFV